MNFFDFQTITFVNQFSRHSWIFDKLIVILQNSSLLKGGVLSTIIWYIWFKRDERQSHNREHTISTLFCCVIAVILARTLALTLPFRIRPLHVVGLHFLLPFGTDPGSLMGWSSFPSDHAVLFFTFSVGLFYISTWVGAFSLCYTILFIIFPRLYLGFHYPTDIIAGAIIGTIIAVLGNIYLVKNRLIKSITNWSYSKPNLFYPLFFLFTYQLAEFFYDSLKLVQGGIELIRYIIA